MASSSSSSALYLLSLSLCLCLGLFSALTDEITLKVVDLENPVLHLVPSTVSGYSTTSAKKTVSCDRVHVGGLPRFKIKSYANSFRVSVMPSVVIPESLHHKIQVCFHRNATLGLCQCGKDNWKSIQNGQWNAVMSPYEDRYVDLMFVDGVSGTITVSIEEEFHQWRLLCLAFGFIVLLLAPFLSKWVPFYYSSSMAIGILLVILFLLFQGMKLLPTGRKSAVYFTLYGSAIGVGSWALHYLSMLVNSILMNFGLSEDMHNPVSILVFVLVILAGAGLGYWIMRKFVISKDGSVDVGIAQFVKWAMRIIAMTFIFQSTLDTPLGMVALASCWAISFSITSPRWRGPRSRNQFQQANGSPWLKRAKNASPNRNRAEFLSRSPEMLSGKTQRNNPKGSFAHDDSPIEGLVKSSPMTRYYSTFHRTPNRKRYSRKEWEDFTRESTREAIAEWASSPEFSDWIVENADRIKLAPEYSSDDSIESEENSSDETVEDSCSMRRFFNW
ncbi:Transmembrane protein 194 [Macleaya cordata]|uniref:Transmembrane protein 194 n=1 Tax=Macleaya cordata TaxID=56857 RepID=A0A200R136_MACCD|nr:Transmembrane protein 194 [Macleaya cordata]